MNTLQSQMDHQDFYSDKINNMTLKQALDIHYLINPQFTPYTEYSSEVASNIIKAHDISHVIFGCNTTMLGEAKVQSRVNSGVDFNLKFQDKFKTLFDKDARSLLLPTGLFSFFFRHINEILAISKEAKIKSRLMTKRWVYFVEDQYMDTTIGDIRSQYNIVL
jgi:ubiquinone biosynthesis protein Coq4